MKRIFSAIAIVLMMLNASAALAGGSPAQYAGYNGLEALQNSGISSLNGNYLSRYGTVSNSSGNSVADAASRIGQNAVQAGRNTLESELSNTLTNAVRQSVHSVIF